MPDAVADPLVITEEMLRDQPPVLQMVEQKHWRAFWKKEVKEFAKDCGITEAQAAHLLR